MPTRAGGEPASTDRSGGGERQATALMAILGSTVLLNNKNTVDAKQCCTNTYCSLPPPNCPTPACDYLGCIYAGECDSPILIDVTGHGFHLTDRAHGVPFEFYGNQSNIVERAKHPAIKMPLAIGLGAGMILRASLSRIALYVLGFLSPLGANIGLEAIPARYVQEAHGLEERDPALDEGRLVALVDMDVGCAHTWESDVTRFHNLFYGLDKEAIALC